MTLQAIGLTIDPQAAPSPSEQAFIAAAEERIRGFLIRNPQVTTLLTSDPRAFCNGLHGLRRQGILRGNRFCDWGSGIGMISGLAALNGFDAYGIESEPAFVTAAEDLCRAFSLAIRFACGSFVPPASNFSVVGTYGATDWHATQGRDVYRELGRSCAEMDLIYAYPWPRELPLYEQLFDSTATEGAILWLYRHGEGPRVMVKTSGPRARPLPP